MRYLPGRFVTQRCPCGPRTEHGRNSFGCQDVAADRLETVPLGCRDVRHQMLKPIGDFGVELLRDEFASRRGGQHHRPAVVQHSLALHQTALLHPVDHTKIEVGDHNLADRRPLYLRNIESNPLVAFVVDDVASTDPWTPRGVTVRGRAEIRTAGGERMGQGFDSTLIVITPASIVSWGIDGPAFGPPNSRKVS